MAFNQGLQEIEKFSKKVIGNRDTETAKAIIAGIPVGVRKSVGIGRQVVSIGRNVLDKAKQVPVLGRAVNSVSPVADEALNIADEVLNAEEDLITLTEQIPVVVDTAADLIEHVKRGNIDNVANSIDRLTNQYRLGQNNVNRFRQRFV